MDARVFINIPSLVLMLRLLFIHPSNTGKYKIVINTVERKGR
jgi:hypothetical protein